MNKTVNHVTDFTDLFLSERDRINGNALYTIENARQAMSGAFKAGYVEFLVTTNEWQLTKRGIEEWRRKKRK